GADRRAVYEALESPDIHRRPRQILAADSGRHRDAGLPTQRLCKEGLHAVSPVQCGTIPGYDGRYREYRWAIRVRYGSNSGGGGGSTNRGRNHCKRQRAGGFRAGFDR
ncbi:unnamed protein product, partial [Ectocarpus fasciculatus]